MAERQSPIIIVKYENINGHFKITLKGKQAIKQGKEIFNDILNNSIKHNILINIYTEVDYTLCKISIDENKCLQVNGCRLVDYNRQFVKINSYGGRNAIKIIYKGIKITLASTRISIYKNRGVHIVIYQGNKRLYYNLNKFPVINRKDIKT